MLLEAGGERQVLGVRCEVLVAVLSHGGGGAGGAGSFSLKVAREEGRGRLDDLELGGSLSGAAIRTLHFDFVKLLQFKALVNQASLKGVVVMMNGGAAAAPLGPPQLGDQMRR